MGLINREVFLFIVFAFTLTYFIFWEESIMEAVFYGIHSMRARSLAV